ncbi:hypothetical protein GLOTRDRAFT_129354 [Gloeophyllum trabeum ATCC 11539]|uniref:Uncharacterized protein n=1 Tax=Gloeophyllum trabeum (strain ATCC 11539 / FP-39264 / Madison 617) TaxID=670483 RepID=S7Q6C7_GLOTA|nr:uncharacterized protein GLOTRDRAFT_129354 [Gloeophyllum trabeum ATCC 11539]EPQ55057.1 hypothetical protein GLOTRDRAFT_129354 [Gloeophyllum trabeum ATCC 11539]
MKFTFATALAGALATLAAAATKPVFVDTPVSLVRCEISTFHWGGGVPPYFVTYRLFNLMPVRRVLDAINNTAVGEFGNTEEDGAEWLVVAPVGDPLYLEVRDSDGHLAVSAQVRVQPGDHEC